MPVSPETVSSPVPYLVPVIDDRFDDTFKPGMKHLGKDINGEDPFVVSQLTLDYLRAMLTEAKGLLQGPLQGKSPRQFPTWVIRKNGS